MENVVLDPQFWAGKRVLLTGHTGFKGGWLALWLRSWGAQVTGFALPPSTTPSLFELARVGEGIDSRMGDLRDLPALLALVRAILSSVAPASNAALPPREWPTMAMRLASICGICSKASTPR